MRKRILNSSAQKPTTTEQQWLDVESLAEVELTSEDADHPFEWALAEDTGKGWKAATSGKQTICLLFDAPLRLRRVRLEFIEEEESRTQEFVLRWLPEGEQSYREVVRQQFNFSPPATTGEVEDYTVKLDRVRALELTIIPDIGGGEARASLATFQLSEEEE